MRPCCITASVYLAGADDGVAGDHQVGLGGVDLGGEDGLRPVGDLDVAPGGAALLRQAAGVLRDHALAFEVRGHAEQLADGDDAGAADAADDDAPGGLGQRQGRLGQRRHRRQVALAVCFFGFFSCPPSTVTKLGQKPLTQE